jgi:G3E family GTPase
MAPIQITLITGFLGSGKTTLLLSLIPQLQSLNQKYKVAILKNEFGDVAIDSQLANSPSISGVREMLNGCICCNQVGELEHALEGLREEIEGLNRVIIETSGSAFPATLAMEINRLAKKTGRYVLDGVVTVIDVENWKGYEDTSYTAKLQARFTDLIVFNKWEGAGEARFDECLDRLGDMEGVEVAWVKSDMGSVPASVIFGIDGGLAMELGDENGLDAHVLDELNHNRSHTSGHHSEVEVLTITLQAVETTTTPMINTTKLQRLLETAHKDEVYRIKAIFDAQIPIPGSDKDAPTPPLIGGTTRYILNWAFGRWTCTPVASTLAEHESSKGILLRMTMILARYESAKWMKKLETEDFITTADDSQALLHVNKVA